jgi:uncharacterized protein YbbC (DUF1343 family)
MSKKVLAMNGIDVLQSRPDLISKSRNIALVSSSAAIDSAGIPVYQAIKKFRGNQLKSIWSLQHGFFIDKQDNMIISDSLYWEALECEVRSLYGDKLVPDECWLEGIDTLLVDIFDVGTRVYTFLNHMVWILKSLSGRDIDVIVLDRPNPLNGIDLAGNIMDESYFSLVGAVSVPMRHGLTAGEFLSYALTVHQIQLKLEIIKARKWKREDFSPGIWTYPSPNMPAFRTALVYPGAVMVEGTNISEGRGTARPFEFIGSPFLENFRLVAELKSLKLKGVTFIPLFFRPEFSKYNGEICNGVLVVPENANGFDAFRVYYEILRIIKAIHPDRFGWKQPPYEFEYQRLPIDMICGSNFIRESLEKNLDFAEIRPVIEAEISEYREKIENFLLY